MITTTEEDPSARFVIGRVLGEGGLGVVFMALDRDFRREVAVKMIHPRYAEHPERRERLRREWLAAGLLEHPGIIPVYAAGEDTRGRLYYAMKLIQGSTLEKAIGRLHRSGFDRNALNSGLRSLLSRFVALCIAIEYAHSRGVIHRDLKPSNCILGIHGETIVIDWGLAKFFGAAYDDLASLTLPGTPLGTPCVIPPEQALGDLHRLGPTTDIAGLGATLYILLVDRPPFQGADVDTILRNAILGQFPRPREVKPDIPRDLELICLKAMSLHPEDRYPSALALALDVERWLAGKVVSAGRTTRTFRPDRRSPWWRVWNTRDEEIATRDPGETQPLA